MAAGHYQRDSSMDALLIVAVLAIAAIGLWFLWRESLILLGFGFALMAVYPFAMLANGLAWLGLAIAPLQATLEVWEVLTREPWSQLDGYFIPIMTIGGRCLAILVLPALMLGYLGSTTLRPDIVYRKRHDLESCIRELGRIWPCARWLSVVNPASEEETAVPADQVAGSHRRFIEWQELFHLSLARTNGYENSKSGSWLLPITVPIYQPPPFGDCESIQINPLLSNIFAVFIA